MYNSQLTHVLYAQLAKQISSKIKSNVLFDMRVLDVVRQYAGYTLNVEKIAEYEVRTSRYLHCKCVDVFFRHMYYIDIGNRIICLSCESSFLYHKDTSDIQFTLEYLDSSLRLVKKYRGYITDSILASVRDDRPNKVFVGDLVAVAYNASVYYYNKSLKLVYHHTEEDLLYVMRDDKLVKIFTILGTDNEYFVIILSSEGNLLVKRFNCSTDYKESGVLDMMLESGNLYLLFNKKVHRMLI